MYAASGSPFSKIYKTSNYGANWVDTRAPVLEYRSVTVDSTGQIVAAAVNNGGIELSMNGGATWEPSFAPTLPWEEICSDDSGQYLVAVNTNFEDGIYWSDNFGYNWTAANTDAEEYVDWRSVTSDATGQYVVAAATDYGGIFVSSNFGKTWNETNAPTNYWSSVSSDKSGVYLTAVINGGKIYTSNNSGLNWYPSNSPSLSWYSVASDATGQFLVAVAGYTPAGIYNSMDYGLNWYASSTENYYFYCVASDSSGRYLAAGTEVFNGILVTDNTGTTYVPSVQPSVVPSTQPTSQPSGSPSSQPSSFPTYKHNTYEQVINVVALEPVARTTINQLGQDRQTYITVDILMSYLSLESGGYITITAGQGLNTIVAATNCAPVSACTYISTICSVNMDITNAMSTSSGGSIALTSTVNTANINGATPQLCNRNGLTNIYYELNYTVSALRQPTFTPTRYPTIAPSPSSGTIIQNKGTVLITSGGAPFYVIGCAMALFAALGVVIVRMHDENKKLTPLRLLAVCFDLSIQGNIIVSELFYIVVLMQSSDKTFTILASVLIFARFQNAICGGYLLYKLYTPSYKLYELLDNEILLLHTKLHSLVQIMMIFDCAMFRYLPWFKSDVTFQSMAFPDSQSFKLCMVTRILQSGIALVVQAIVLDRLNKSDIDDLYTEVLLTLILTMTIIVFVSIVLTVCMHLRGFEVISGEDTETTNAIHDVELQTVSGGTVNTVNTVYEERVALLEREVSALKTLHSTHTAQYNELKLQNDTRISELAKELQEIKTRLSSQI
eukprot:gene9801-11509_t